MKNLSLVVLLICCLTWQSKAQYNNDLIIIPILKTDTTSLGQKIIYPSTSNAEVTMLKITIPPGKTTGWHEHAIPVFAYVLKGTLTVELEGNKVLKFAENSSFSEVIHTAHRGINKESSDLVLLAIYLGEKGKPLSVKIQKE
ncbi:MAG: cupin domain-containing protein [Prolixibacteraceae bacterium]|nr:cupin domain-containing protein [Prolixibacteraceae bacterium]